MPRTRHLLTAAAVAAVAPASVASAQIVAGTDFDGNDPALTGFFDSRTTPQASTPPGRAFGVRNRNVTVNDVGLPFNLSDDSVSGAAGNGTFAADERGVFGQAKTDNFFAENDADNVSNLPAFAVWSFDLDTPTTIDTFSIDLGAQSSGFEADDVYRFIIDPNPANGSTADEITLLEFTGSTDFDDDDDLDPQSDRFTYRPLDNGQAFTFERPLRLASAFGATNVPLQTAVDKSVAETGEIDTFSVDISALGELDTFDFIFERDGAFSSTAEGVAFDNVAFLVEDDAGLPGDANNDGVVDLADFGILRSEFGMGGGMLLADFNDDGTVDLADFGILRANFGSSADVGALDAWYASVVPEPTSLALAGLAGLGLLRRRRA